MYQAMLQYNYVLKYDHIHLRPNHVGYCHVYHRVYEFVYCACIPCFAIECRLQLKELLQNLREHIKTVGLCINSNFQMNNWLC